MLIFKTQHHRPRKGNPWQAIINIYVWPICAYVFKPMHPFHIFYHPYQSMYMRTINLVTNFISQALNRGKNNKSREEEFQMLKLRNFFKNSGLIIFLSLSASKWLKKWEKAERNYNSSCRFASSLSFVSFFSLSLLSAHALFSQLSLILLDI